MSVPTSLRCLIMTCLLSVAALTPSALAQVELAPIPTLPPGNLVWQAPAEEPVIPKTPEVSSDQATTRPTSVNADREDELQNIQEKFDKRLKELEEKFKKQAEEEEQAEEQAKKKPSFKAGGRIHLDHWAFPSSEPGLGFLEHPNPTSPNYGDDPEDRVLFRRIRLELSGDIPQNMLWRMQIDFNNPSTPEYKDVYLGWNELPGNQTLLLGNQKRPLGLDHLNSSRFNVFAERPLVVEAFNEDARRIGACFYGYSDDESRNWQYGIFSLENTSTSGRFIGDSMQLGGYSRLAASPWYSADGRCYSHWALAGALARPDGDTTAAETNRNEGRFRTRPEGRSDARWLDTGEIRGANWYEIVAAENILNYGPFQLTSEYMVNFLQRDNLTPGTGPDLFFHGFYVYGAYFLTGEYMPYDRTSGTLDRVIPHQNFFLIDRLCGKHSVGGWGALQIAARYDYLDLTDQDIAGGVEQNFTVGLNWHWNAYAKVQTNLIFGDIRDHRPVNGFDGGNFTIIGTRWMCDF